MVVNHLTVSDLLTTGFLQLSGSYHPLFPTLDTNLTLFLSLPIHLKDLSGRKWEMWLEK